MAADTVYYYYTNPLHSAVVITDAHGTVVEGPTYYAPYGQVPNRSLRDGPGYTGVEEDPATSLDYMQQRYYDPQSGRFLSTDPVLPTSDGDGFNRYEYANDNPYRYTDPEGQCADGTCAIMVRNYGAWADSHPAEADKLGGTVGIAGVAAMLSVTGLSEAVGLVKVAVTVDKALSDSRASIYGKPQVTRAGGQETTHASTSTRLANEQAGRPDAQSVHLNQRISTVTNNGVKSSLRPDVATVRTDGKVDVHEVLSPRQEPNSTAAKYNNALGSRAGAIKCVPPDKC